MDLFDQGDASDPEDDTEAEDTDNSDNTSIDTFDVPEEQRAEWITTYGTEFYPDLLAEREARHQPTLMEFRDLVEESESSENLLRRIMQQPNSQPTRRRTQLCRLFNKYVSPDTPVERLKVIKRTDETIREFGDDFRDIDTVEKKLFNRSEEDEALFAILGEYDDRGSSGYELTGNFFDWFEAEFEDSPLQIDGPRGPGSDVILSNHLPEYQHEIPADFLISSGDTPVCVGFARYDQTRGGSQEDDRPKGNERHAAQILGYSPPDPYPPLKLLFINDGPGLLLGSMWEDYVRLEELDEDRVMVCTLQMLDGRLTQSWLLGQLGT